jgi:hypothetical protein
MGCRSPSTPRPWLPARHRWPAHRAAAPCWVQVPREDPSYSLFLSLGNDKLPTFAGIGHVNMYM